MKDKFSLFFKLMQKLFYVYLIILGLFLLFRLSILFVFGDFSELINYKIDVLNAFYVGAKFDTSVIAYGLLPILLYALIFSIFYIKNNKRRYYYFSVISKWYFVFISMVFLIILITDYFFYSYFQTHISPVIYGLKNDKTSAILLSMWTDYPVIKILLVIILFFFIFKSLFAKVLDVISKKQISFKKLNPIVFILILGVYFIALRGSLGMFPLRLDHTSISTNTFVNELVLNGPFALKIAKGLQEESSAVHIDNKRTLKHYSFKSKKEALEVYLGKSINDNNVKRVLTIKTKQNDFLQKNPPNVVFVLMESFSNHYFDLHSKELNLFGELEQELANCYVFRNFLSAENLTVETLEGILLGTPNSPISQSPYYNIQFNSSVATPFKEAGYQTSYLTGGQLGWRNTGRLIKKQNFDIIQGSSFLEKKYKNPEYFTWGIHDEYLYKHLFDVLNKSKKPQFIFALTISNHTPYDLPKHFKKPKLTLSDSILDKLSTKKEIALKNLTSYHYSATELGKFIKRIRNSPLGDNTIIVATGDHNVRGIFKYNSDELFYKKSVPLIMYVPEKYKPSFVNLKRFGSHKDIFPTIFNLSLSNKSFIKTGNDLFSTIKTNYFAENEHTTTGNKYGVVIRNSNKKAYYYKWKDSLNYKGLISTTIEKTPELLSLKRKMEAHGATMMLNIQDEIIINSDK